MRIGRKGGIVIVLGVVVACGLVIFPPFRTAPPEMPPPAPALVAEPQRAYSSRAFTMMSALSKDMMARLERDHQTVSSENYQIRNDVPPESLARHYTDALGGGWTAYEPDLPRGYAGAWGYGWRHHGGGTFLLLGLPALQGETYAPVYTLTGR